MNEVPQKHPQDRKHIWEYANPHVDTPPVPHDPEWPKAVYRHSAAHAHAPDHPGYASTTVADQAALDAALADGWVLSIG